MPVCLSIYLLGFYTRWCRMHPLCAFDFSCLILCYGDVICTPPLTLPPYSGLGPAQVPFFGSRGQVFGLRIKQKSRLKCLPWPGFEPRISTVLMAANVITRQQRTCTESMFESGDF